MEKSSHGNSKNKKRYNSVIINFILWSFTTYSYNTDYACHVYMYSGNMHYNNKTARNYVWLVRSGNYDDLGNLIIGALDIDEPLFTDNQDGIIIDNRTNLMWTK